MADYAVIGMQFGSEGKGGITAHLASRFNFDAAACNFSPNAGHTVTIDGRKHVATSLPVTSIFPWCRWALLGPGAIIDLDKLEDELARVRDMRQWLSAFYAQKNESFTVVVHPNAAIVHADHRLREADYVALGSTMKGTAEAAIDRMQRTKGSRNIARDAMFPTGVVTHQALYDYVMNSSQHIMVEGCQGHSLSLYGSFYPYCTSRDTSIWQLLADVAWPRGRGMPTVVGAIRTYPIRVANRYDADGNIIGTSGPCYPDQQETTFEAIGVPTEYTTVTKLPRRVFTYSHAQVCEAFRINRPELLYVSFMDYLPAGQQQNDFIHQVQKAGHGAHVRFASYGPDLLDMRELS